MPDTLPQMLPEKVLEKKIRFSWKFYAGILLVIVSAILGTVTKIFFFLYIYDAFQMWLWGILYLLSWPMLILGGWWVGKEYYDKIKKYADYRFYHESMKNKSRDFVSKARNTSQKIGAKAKAQGAKVKEDVKKNFDKAKTNLNKVRSKFKKKKS